MGALAEAHYRWTRRLWRREDRLRTYRRDGIVVTEVRPQGSWARSTHPAARPALSHLPEMTLIAWRDGEPVQSFTYYLCGQTSFYAVVESVIPYKVCHRCASVAKTRVANLLDYRPAPVEVLW